MIDKYLARLRNYKHSQSIDGRMLSGLPSERFRIYLSGRKYRSALFPF